MWGKRQDAGRQCKDEASFFPIHILTARLELVCAFALAAFTYFQGQQERCSQSKMGRIASELGVHSVHITVQTACPQHPGAPGLHDPGEIEGRDELEQAKRLGESM
jgi:hypothetical protein